MLYFRGRCSSNDPRDTLVYANKLIKIAQVNSEKLGARRKQPVPPQLTLSPYGGGTATLSSS
jgi:hypothetical protein